MSKQDESRDNLLYGNVFKTMLSLSVPAILGMVVIGLYKFHGCCFCGPYGWTGSDDSSKGMILFMK